MYPTIEYRPGRGYNVSQIVSYHSDFRIAIYATKKMASDIARRGGWKRSDVVKVWTPLYGGYMPAYASQNGQGENTLIFLTTDFLTCEFVVKDMAREREAA